jgi:hypothetical protein
VPRYFFHLHSPAGISRDAVGIVLPDVAGAISEAIRAATYIIRTPTKDTRSDWRGWRIEVTDDKAQPCFTMPFESALQRLVSSGWG